jgi:hypothetical protein
MTIRQRYRPILRLHIRAATVEQSPGSWLLEKRVRASCSLAMIINARPAAYFGNAVAWLQITATERPQARDEHITAKDLTSEGSEEQTLLESYPAAEFVHALTQIATRRAQLDGARQWHRWRCPVQFTLRCWPQSLGLRHHLVLDWRRTWTGSRRYSWYRLGHNEPLRFLAILLVQSAHHEA